MATVDVQQVIRCDDVAEYTAVLAKVNGWNATGATPQIASVSSNLNQRRITVIFATYPLALPL